MRERHGYKMKKKKTIFGMLRGLLLPCAVVVIFLGFTSALGNLQSGREGEDIRRLREVLQKGCVACYAAEGIYPPDLQYLKERYGIQVDEDRYTVYYNCFAQNLMPEVTVLENRP